MTPKIVAQKPKKAKSNFFSENHFFIGSPRTHARLFWQHCWKIFDKLPKTFAENTKNDIFIFLTKKNVFPQTLSTWQVQCSFFNKTLKNFPIKSWIIFARNPNFFSKNICCSIFSLDTWKNSFGNLSGRNCQNPKFFLSYSENVSKIRSF